MVIEQSNKIDLILNQLFNDSKNDHYKIMKGLAKSAFRPIQPIDFKDVYLSISKEQGKELVALIKENNLKNIVEFGTSFGISTLFLAQGILETKGKIITTELIESKAKTAIENLTKASVKDLVDVRIGNAMNTLKDHDEPIDLLFLDGWKDLYLPLFNMLASNFHKHTIIYVDNANMAASKLFLKEIAETEKHQLESKFGGKVVLISMKK
ncbi:O-methyltransferase [Polaribacter sp. KT25b]|uniref:O-methyltransferase n=1 Tax=Polaribacter sp. KT25b TaxID=1855336 RepID=UPI00087A4DE5|nr:class I SAM-dependent methyltransferase [Polaribacter sp. KT25b]SDS31974.1 O-methyltransferase [Polaribacter sp. KT25b]